MAELPTQAFVSSSTNDGSSFMRPFAIGMTAYLITYNLIYMITRGQFRSPDVFSDVYFFVLAPYAAAPEIKRLANQPAAPDPEGWRERLRKGGPLITLWFLLWIGAATWRLYDPTVPMPSELKTTLMQVISLFFGTYALRQYRHRVGRRAAQEAISADGTPGDGREPRQRIAAYLQEKGASSVSILERDLMIPRRTLNHVLRLMVEEGLILRDGRSLTDPQTVYRVK